MYKKLKMKDEVFWIGKMPTGCSSLFLNQLIQKIFTLSRKEKILQTRSSVVLTVSFVDTKTMRELNKKFRKKNSPTDVLSFEQQGSELNRHNEVQFLGDLVFCVPVLQSQAKAQRHSVKTELQVLLVHGFLHLLGYDHEKSAREEAKMRQLEQKLVQKLSRRLPKQFNGLLKRNSVKSAT